MVVATDMAATGTGTGRMEDTVITARTDITAIRAMLTATDATIDLTDLTTITVRIIADRITATETIAER